MRTKHNPLPLKYKSEGRKTAVQGMHDISARLRLPKDLTTLAMPYDMLIEIYKDIDESFIIREVENN